MSNELDVHAGRSAPPIVIEPADPEPLTIEQVREALDEGAKERAAAERVTRGRRIVRR